MVLGLGTLGVDVPALLRRVGLSLEALQDPDARFSPEQGLELVHLAIEAGGGDNLGLRLAELYEPGVFGVLDHLAHSARTLREAIELLCRYERIHQNGMRTELQVRGPRAFISHTMLHPYPLPRQVSESTLANLTAIGRKLTGIDYAPLDVWFAHPAPADTREHERFFRCRLHWEAAHDALCIPAELLDTPLRKPNTRLVHVLEQHARELLQKLSIEGSFRDRVRERMCIELPRGSASLESLAAALGMSARTLQRRLRSEGTSHAALLEELRRKLAEEYLQRSGLGTEDVAVMLGFSDSRAFRRAFKSWTGQSPIEFRTQTKR
jgi:AraC-like DNA-binding protein